MAEPTKKLYFSTMEELSDIMQYLEHDAILSLQEIENHPKLKFEITISVFDYDSALAAYNADRYTGYTNTDNYQN